MIHIRRKNDRGHAEHGWLESFHTFSFADYYDPEFMGFRTLRVINEDYVKGGQGFGTHGHKDMEIVTYVLEGALEHKDSMGTGAIIRPGEVQYMSAGSGVTHSEFNASKTERVHLLQIWLLPNEKGAKPRYDQKNFSLLEKHGKLRLVVSPDGAEGSIAIRQNAKILASVLDEGQSVNYPLPKNRYAWLQLARGEILLNGERMTAGDGAGIEGLGELKIQGAVKGSEFLLFDL